MSISVNEKNISFDIIIPTYKPDAEFYELLSHLAFQVREADNIFIVNTEEESWDKGFEIRFPKIKVRHIKKEDFDHGGTRAAAARESSADVIVFMTQDALPLNAHTFENLLRPIEENKAEISYGRQIPKSDADPIERFTRNFNYPEKSRIKSKDDLDELGIKTFFCTNVCCAYLRSVYDMLGGFPEHVIFNEDSILAAKAIMSGYRVSYTADAAVLHSHSYSGAEQFHRNFDLGVSHAMFPEIFSLCQSEREGMRLVKATAANLIDNKHVLLIFKLLWLSACKLLGYSMGKRFKKLPKVLLKKCTMNPGFWTRYYTDGGKNV